MSCDWGDPQKINGRRARKNEAKRRKGMEPGGDCSAQGTDAFPKLTRVTELREGREKKKKTLEWRWYLMTEAQSLD